MLPRASVSLLWLSLLIGCTIPIQQGDSIYTFGMVKTPTVQNCTDHDQSCYALGRYSEHYGLRFSQGVSIGYTEQNLVMVPLDCRVVLLVHNQAQFEMAYELYKSEIDKGGLCAAITPD